MDFSIVASYMDTLVRSGLPCCDISVFQSHQPIFSYRAGWKDENRRIPLNGDETYNLYSCSKVFTSCAAMQLIQHGMLHLDDPVEKYLPAYGSLRVRSGDKSHPAERVMLIRHLMSMQSGLNYDRNTSEIERSCADRCRISAADGSFRHLERSVEGTGGSGGNK